MARYLTAEEKAEKARIARESKANQKKKLDETFARLASEGWETCSGTRRVQSGKYRPDDGMGWCKTCEQWVPGSSQSRWGDVTLGQHMRRNHGLTRHKPLEAKERGKRK